MITYLNSLKQKRDEVDISNWSYGRKRIYDL